MTDVNDRSSFDSNPPAPSDATGAADTTPPSIALLMDAGADRSLLEDHLALRYTVHTGSTSLLDDDIDLCFVDETGLTRHTETLQRWKASHEPVFCPVVLLSRAAERRRGDEAVWDLVDDVLSIPVKKAELVARVESMVDNRARSLKLDATRRLLSDQNDHLAAFASDVAHDIRNPLEVAGGYLEQVRKEYDSPHIDEIETSLDRIDTIVEETLQIARGGLIVADREPVDVGELATRAWKTCATEQATLRFADDLGSVLADAGRLQTVFENLFRNAVDHGGSDIVVTIGATPGGFYVEDDGPGIPEAGRDDVFSMGYTTSADGTGHGLGIVKQIVTAHGWTIAIRDGSSGGTKFAITDT